MYENLDDLIEVNLKLLYASKSQFMMRINFKDELGYNLKNTLVFAEILSEKGIIDLEKEQGFRCDLTDFGRQIYESGGWKKYLQTIENFAKFKTIVEMDSDVIELREHYKKRIIVAGALVLIFCFLITFLTIEVLRMP